MKNIGKKLAVVILIISTLLVCAFLLYWRIYYSPLEFDSAVWQQGDNVKRSSATPRLRMIDGLISSGVLLGKTPNEIDLMLGKPTDTNYFADFDVVYWLGKERGFISIDSEWLVIGFGDNGKTSEVHVVRD